LTVAVVVVVGWQSACVGSPFYVSDSWGLASALAALSAASSSLCKGRVVFEWPGTYYVSKQYDLSGLTVTLDGSIVSNGSVRLVANSSSAGFLSLTNGESCVGGGMGADIVG
jgi:hypothetical protein